MSHADSEADPLVALAEEFADRYRRGERPSLSEYAGRYPEYADRIRRLFPAMVAMEQLGSSAEWSGGRPAGPRIGAAPERLGEYRILREIARGGMGVVYEAVQESLGRHVALKVLPFHRLVRDSQLERFRREARAAARLHHTNIVPVFGVGESEGVHYYAMQFIQGQNLDAVLQEVRRLRGVPVEGRPDATRPSGLGAGLARDLISGGPPPTLAAVEQPAATGPPPGSGPPPMPAGSSPTVVDSAAPGSGSELAARPEIQYIRGVARIGLQVAEAMEYAHQQGILHRDIKPANILLDTQGTAWVTDFGLAKAEDSAELTHQGDIVGTLRYMAPERFGGRADRRSDIYGLGLTLYEMLTLRSGFTSGDRARLIERVLHDEPPRPRRVDPRIPRDLETVVLKAMAKEPGRRYATASAMAEDLRRFLSDRPIRARRTPAWEHAWRFCRRNPALALATGAAASLLAALVVGWAMWTARIDRARRAEQAARRDAQEKLWREYLARAQAGRSGRRPGRRLDSLEAIREAVPIARDLGAPRSSLAELRDEAIACLALPDLRAGPIEIATPAGAIDPSFDATFRRYALADPGGEVRVYEAGREVPIARMPGPGGAVRGLWLSPDGRSVAISTRAGAEVREVDSGRIVFARAVGAVSAGFAADSRRAAIGFEDGTVVVVDPASGREAGRFVVGLQPVPLAMRPDGRRLAVADETRHAGVQIWDLDPPRRAEALGFGDRGPAAALAWSPDGARLGVSLERLPSVEIWDLAEHRPAATLEGHAQRVSRLAFHPDGDLMVTMSWDGTGRLWDAGTGRALVQWPSYITDPHFSRDGRTCGVVDLGGRRRLLEVDPGREYRTLIAGIGTARSEYYRADIGPDGLLVVGMQDGARLWDLDSGRELAFLPIGPCRSAHLVAGARGRELITCGIPSGLRRWPIDRDPSAPGRLRIGGSRKVRLPMEPTLASMGPDGRAAVVTCEDSGAAVVLDLADESVRCTLLHPEISFGTLSPDGRWAATSGWHTPIVKVWDARTGAPAAEVRTGEQNLAFFSPDGRSMIACAVGRYDFREVPSWRPVRELRREVPSYPGWVAFSPDHKLVALELAPGAIHLLDPGTGRVLARLRDPDAGLARWLGFTPDGGRLVAVTGYTKAIRVWDLRGIARRLVEIGLGEELVAAIPVGGPDPPPGRTTGIRVDASAAVAASLVEAARARIDRRRRELETRPGDAMGCNNLAWAYLVAPEPMRDDARAMELVQAALRLEPGNPVFRNTLGVACYRAGRYREAIEALRLDLDAQEERFLPWDLCFLAMSYHRLGDRDRAREYRSWALRWSREQKGLSTDDFHELAAIREEMEATLGR